MTSADKTPQIFISPTLDKSIEVLATLAHEMCHAVLDCKGGHKGPFVRLMKLIGLTGKPTATIAGPELTERLNAIVQRIGEYPHSALVPMERKKPGSRLRLYMCECPVKVRVASDDFDATCNACGALFARQG